MEKLEKIEREYIFKSSPGVMYSFLTEPSGLSEWFCDNVNVKGNIYSFIWNKDSEQKAQKLGSKENLFARYRWLDGPENAYFEMRMSKDELTSELALIITDYVDPEDVDETVLFWNSAINKLQSVIGS